MAAILVADLILVGVNWRLAQSPRVSAGDLRRLELAEKFYCADTARLQKFRNELPADEKQWDEFYTAGFRSAGSGYSAISSDLGELSREQFGPSTIESSIEELLRNLICRAGISS